MIRLEELRTNALLTIPELAAETGVSRWTIQSLESGRRRKPRIATLKPLAEYFGEPAADLMKVVPEGPADQAVAA